MAIWQGTYWRVIFRLQDRAGAPIPIYGWEFRAQFREDASDEPALLELTTANGGFEVVDAGNGRFAMQISAVQSEALPEAPLVFDVLRTDIDPGPLLLFWGSVPVAIPVTRDG